MKSLSTNRNDRPGRSIGAMKLACVTIAAALFAAAPALVDVVDYVRFSDAPGVTFVSRRALLILWLSLLQAAYGAFLMLWPHGAAVWSVTVSLLAHAAIYALTLGVVLINGRGGVLMADTRLPLTDNLTGGRAALWCVCMVSLWTLLAFFAGRLALEWRRADVLARQAPPHAT